MCVSEIKRVSGGTPQNVTGATTVYQYDDGSTMTVNAHGDPIGSTPASGTPTGPANPNACNSAALGAGGIGAVGFGTICAAGGPIAAVCAGIGALAGAGYALLNNPSCAPTSQP
jgi:hypothetical protein